MNHQSQNHSYPITDAIKIFSSVTGIAIHRISLTEDRTLCMHCNHCTDTIMELLSLKNSPFYCNLYFFPCGTCHIFTLSVYDSSAFYISEPIVCEIINNVSCEMQQNASILYVSPTKLFETAKLLYTVANHTLKPFFDVLPYCTLKNNLIEAVLHGDSERVLQLIDNSLDEILAYTGLNFYKTKAACTKIIFLLFEISSKCMASVFYDKNRRFSFLNFAKADTLGQLKLCLSDFCDDFLHIMACNSNLKRHTVINRATALIESHFNDKITQNSIANDVYLSPSYFSKLFKDVTGYNFNEYVNRIRIEKAKEMLEKSFLSIDDVYQKVGYENRSYFGKVFRNLTGMTPKQYKDMFRHTSEM